MRVRVKICCIASLHEAAMAVAAGADALGLVGPMPSGPGVLDAARLTEIAAGLPPPVAGVLRTVQDGGAPHRIPLYAPHVHAFLLDSGRPAGAVAELGGTGRTHDWSVSADFVAQSPRPVVLAGGLNPENVGEAIARVRPFGVDVCTGVRTGGRLDTSKLDAFMAAVARGRSGPV